MRTNDLAAGAVAGIMTKVDSTTCSGNPFARLMRIASSSVLSMIEQRLVCSTSGLDSDQHGRPCRALSSLPGVLSIPQEPTIIITPLNTMALLQVSGS